MQAVGPSNTFWKGALCAMVEIKMMRPGEEEIVSALVTLTFQHEVAPLYTEEGVNEFLSYVTPDSLKSRLARNHVVLVAFQEEVIIGMIELRNYCHVSLLFVDPRYQHKGVGHRLVTEAFKLIQTHNNEVCEVTVNSSPNAVEAYKRFGFQVTNELQVKNGIGFVPMTLFL
jgi:ribosomal protein S18 acetylase RimI-like enzyme